MTYQLEIGEQGTPHLQGYLELGNRARLRQLKRMIGCPSIHLQRRRGTQQQAIDYCNKTDTRAAEPVTIGVRDSSLAATGQTTSKLDVLALRSRSSSIQELADEFPGAVMMYYNKIRADQSRRLYDEVSNTPVKRTCYLLVGPSGVGKTSRVMKETAAAGMKLIRPYFGGSQGNRVLWFPEEYDPELYKACLIDDYNGSDMVLTDLLQLLDEYPVTVNVKGASRLFLCTHVFITTNIPLERWYLGEDEEQRLALKRRFKFIWKIKRKRQQIRMPEEAEIDDDELENILSRNIRRRTEEVPRIQDTVIELD